ncbi:MAG: hypothetical protein H0W62_04075 [Chitinophagales bacterium]|nr:hypothetical protein [Chitinophagales bacterium]
MKKIAIASIFSAMIIGSAVLAGNSLNKITCPDHSNSISTKAGTTSAVNDKLHTDNSLCTDSKDCSKCSK